METCTSLGPNIILLVYCFPWSPFLTVNGWVIYVWMYTHIPKHILTTHRNVRILHFWLVSLREWHEWPTPRDTPILTMWKVGPCATLRRWNVTESRGKSTTMFTKTKDIVHYLKGVHVWRNTTGTEIGGQCADCQLYQFVIVVMKKGKWVPQYILMHKW